MNCQCKAVTSRTLALLECEIGMLAGRRGKVWSPIYRAEETTTGELYVVLMCVLQREYCKFSSFRKGRQKLFQKIYLSEMVPKEKDEM